ncbi:MAG: hypothetical protein L0Y67_04215 [Gammaproteobacteria bacterium]|nr:hypothetical protein [Gammaproteobacteria bacterium]MCI0590798.1 hypothetical protein [Gammaproteobacteria bacterium]
MLRNFFTKLLLVSALLIGAPLLGALLAGKPLAVYLELPPITRHVAHAAFSWPLFITFSLCALLLIAYLVFLAVPTEVSSLRAERSQRSLPWWGCLALILLAIFWLLAWTRFHWFQSLQQFTFTPLWLSYVLLVNALTYSRTSACLITHRPAYLVSLFPTSVVFWWYFEYLNRFAQNWHYIGIENFGRGEYTLHTSLAFSTVLPAVISTLDWLKSFPQLAGLRNKRPVAIHPSKQVALLAIMLAFLGLMALAIWPDYLFPLIWIAPSILIMSLQVIEGEHTAFAALAEGDWRPVYLPAIAALLCGFFWEMFNYVSYAKWIYSIPFAHRFEIFEMPVLGYLGYLPFGLECLVVADLVERLGYRGAAGKGH